MHLEHGLPRRDVVCDVEHKAARRSSAPIGCDASFWAELCKDVTAHETAGADDEETARSRHGAIGEAMLTFMTTS